MPGLEQRGIVHIFVILLLIVGIISGVYLVQKTQVFKPKASATLPNPLITTVTENLTKAKNNNESVEQMVALARERKDLLISEITESPGNFLLNATLADQRDEFPEEVRPYLESRVSESGIAIVGHSDNLEEKVAKKYASLDGNESDYLLVSEKDPLIETGDQIFAQGVAIDNLLVGQYTKTSSRISLQPPDQRSFKVGVVFLQFDRGQLEDVDINRVKLTIFDQNYSAADFYKVNSGDKISVDGDIIGHFTVLSNRTKCNNDNFYIWKYLWAVDVERQAKEQGINLNSYDSIVYIVPPNNLCSGVRDIGAGTVGKNDSNPAKTWIYKEYYNPQVYIHELGHNFKLHHANALDCGSMSIDSAQKCESKEYEDAYDPMGFFIGKSYGLNAPHKLALGVLDSDQILAYPRENLSSEGITGRIVSLGKNPKKSEYYTGLEANVIRIPKEDTGEYYYISYRSSDNFYDNDLPEAAKKGVYIHVWDGIPDHQTKLINVRGGANIEEAPLSDGQTFYDRVNSLWITQILHTNDLATVRIGTLMGPSDSIKFNCSFSELNSSCSSGTQLCTGYTDNEKCQGKNPKDCFNIGQCLYDQEKGSKCECVDQSKNNEGALNCTFSESNTSCETGYHKVCTGLSSNPFCKRKKPVDCQNPGTLPDPWDKCHYVEGKSECQECVPIN